MQGRIGVPLDADHQPLHGIRRTGARKYDLEFGEPRHGREHVNNDIGVDQHSPAFDQIAGAPRRRNHALARAAADRARRARQRDDIADEIAQQHGAATMQMGDGERAALAVSEASAGFGLDHFEMVKIGHEVLRRRVLSALHQPALHLGEGVAGADCDRGRAHPGELGA